MVACSRWTPEVPGQCSRVTPPNSNALERENDWPDDAACALLRHVREQVRQLRGIDFGRLSKRHVLALVCLGIFTEDGKLTRSAAPSGATSGCSRRRRRCRSLRTSKVLEASGTSGALEISKNSLASPEP